MKRREFFTTIDAPREKVWNVLWDRGTYPKWTAPFCEGSSVETDWKEGGKVKFLGPDGNGMLSRIKRNDPHHLMYIEHLGVVKGGAEDTESRDATKWKGAVENYTLTELDGETKVHVETDIDEEYLDSFEEAWPEALRKVKELSEK